MLEAAQYSANSFVTLTYRDSDIPLTVDGLQTLHLPHIQNWLKRFRKAIEPERVRYFVVGEYGDETERPHYHIALFNFESCRRGRTLRRPGSGRPVWEKCCVACQTVGETWGHGDVDLGILETSSAQYICGYVTKKLTFSNDYRLKGRSPEFARMSLRPGIGQSAMHEVASQLLRFNLVDTQADVPSALRHGSRLFPLGRYLRQNLRRMVGRDEKAPQIVQETHKEELRALRESAFDASISFKAALLDANSQVRASAKGRYKLKQRKKSL